MSLHSVLRTATRLPCGSSDRPARLTAGIPLLPTASGMSCSGSFRTVSSLARRRCGWAVASAVATEASSTTAGDDDEDMGLGTSGAFDEAALGPLPEVRHQSPMHNKERKAWRSKAEAMAQEKRLVNIQIGQLGITPAFLRAAADILQKHSLVRVKLGEGCGLERREAANLLERYLDCVCVHQIGFTVTLYRQAGLPRPSNTRYEGDAEDVAAVAQAAKEAAAAASAQAALEKVKRKRAGQESPTDRPAEFSVLKRK